MRYTDNYGTNAAVIGVPAYNEDTYTLAFRVIYETNPQYPSTNPTYNAGQLTFYLNSIIYNQAVVKWWNVTKLDDKTVNFDLNSDGMLNVSSWTTAEMDVIMENCDDDRFDYIIFLVDNPSDGSLGYMYPNQRYGFVHADESDYDENTTAHELGHGAFGLYDLGTPQHPSNDLNNLMHQTEPCPERLRKFQWDIIHGLGE